MINDYCYLVDEVEYFIKTMFGVLVRRLVFDNYFR